MMTSFPRRERTAVLAAMALLAAVAGGANVSGQNVTAQSPATAQSPVTARSPATSAVAGAAVSRGDDAESLERTLSRRGSVSFRDTPLSAVVFSLSEVWGVNIVAGGDVEGQVSGVFENAPLSEVLDAVLGANGFAYRRSGQSLIVLPIEKVGSDDPSFRSRTLQLPSSGSDTEALIKAATMLLGPRGQIQPLPASGSVLVVDTPERIDRVSTFFEGLRSNASAAAMRHGGSREAYDAHPGTAGIEYVQPQVSYFAPQFISALALAGPLGDGLGPTAILSVMEDENRLMVIGTVDQLQLASQIVRVLDTPRPQVRITALIYDVELRRREELGIDWGKTLRVNGSYGGVMATSAAGGSAAAPGTGTDGGATDAASAAAAGLAITLGTLDDTFTLGNVIKALDETRGAHLLADPTITVVDRSEASIKIVTKIPYQQLTQTQQGGNIGTTAFEEAGITLTVTPRIAGDGTIQMKVRPEFSTFVEFINGQPLIDSRAAETDVRVADRHTLVIGGLRRKQMSDGISGVPGLFKLKHVGRLFGAHESGVTESELLVFLRPEITTPYDQLRPRECNAACLSGFHLDGIPVADHRPMVPYCNDKNCVYHHPRPNVNAGGPSTQFVESAPMIGGIGIEHHLLRPAIIEEPPAAPPQRIAPPPRQ